MSWQVEVPSSSAIQILAKLPASTTAIDGTHKAKKTGPLNVNDAAAAAAAQAPFIFMPTRDSSE